MADANKDKKGNIRDYASLEQLLVLANLESLNAEFIRMGLSNTERLQKLNLAAINQMNSLVTSNTTQRLAKLTENQLLNLGKK